MGGASASLAASSTKAVETLMYRRALYYFFDFFFWGGGGGPEFAEFQRTGRNSNQAKPQKPEVRGGWNSEPRQGSS